MSTINCAFGLIAVMEVPLNDEDREDLEEFFFEKSKLSLTYDGKSIYLDFNEDEEDFYITQVGFPDLTENTKVFLAELSKFNIKVKEETIKPFITIWYNGSDCPLNLLTGDEITKGY